MTFDAITDAVHRREHRLRNEFGVSALSATMADDAVLRNREVLGEAANNVPSDVRGLDEEIPWHRITGLRDVLALAYFGIDDDIVWSVVAEELPTLLPRSLATTRPALSSHALLSSTDN